jgi:hypothetical protein
MSLTKELAVTAAILVGAICMVGYSQTATTSEGVTVTIPESVFTYVDTAAIYIGHGIISAMNQGIRGEISGDFERPIGYLGLVTGILLLFSLSKFLRKVLWVGVVAGWALLVVRVVLDVTRG